MAAVLEGYPARWPPGGGWTQNPQGPDRRRRLLRAGTGTEILVAMEERLQGLRDGVQALVGLECWGAVAGLGTAARFALDFGRKFPRSRPVSNESLTRVVRENESEYSLFVQNAPWRAQSTTAVVASWVDDNANDGPQVGALNRLVGARVLRASLLAPAQDLSLEFDNGLALVVFADGTPRSDEDDYILFTRHHAYSVSRGGQVQVEERLLDVDFHDQPVGRSGS
jgi:hypothetical protein